MRVLSLMVGSYSLSIVVSQQGVLVDLFSDHMNHRTTLLSDWMCIICGCVNFARRTSCFQCNEPRTDDAPLADMSSSNPTSFGKKGETGPTHVLLVRGLDENADEEMLRYEFSKNAPIKDIRLVRDKFTHVSRGFAFVHFHSVDIAIPEVFVGGLLGSMLIFLFSAWACAAVGRTAQEVVNEVRRQFIERPGIMDYKEKPDYGRCVAIVASASLREMIKPGALAVLSPIFIGILFRVLGYYTGQPLLGAKVVAAMLMFATVSGILMALFLNTAGGAWDNAKKYIETGALGGKGSDSHKAAITGDTVGDPFKDTAGPSLHVLIKMLATITLVMAPIFL